MLVTHLMVWQVLSQVVLTPDQPAGQPPTTLGTALKYTHIHPQYEFNKRFVNLSVVIPNKMDNIPSTFLFDWLHAYIVKAFFLCNLSVKDNLCYLTPFNVCIVQLQVSGSMVVNTVWNFFV